MNPHPHLLAFILLIPLACASIGDRQPSFLACVDDCLLSSALEGDQGQVKGQTKGWSGGGLAWTMVDECRYTCMHRLTDAAVQSSTPIYQYYGKWPFWRILRMQEPFSVFFSLTNLFPQIYALKYKLKPARRYQRLRWLAYINCAAWISSVVFHCRDRPWTERADYFMAAASIISGTQYIFTRSFPRIPSTLVSVIASALWLAHCLKLSLWRFDYGYNMKFNLAIGMIHNMLWIRYALKSPINQPRRLWPIHCVIGISLALLLEVFDFPAWHRLLDAHALWHAATSPIAVAWWLYLKTDSNWRRGSQFTEASNVAATQVRSR